MMRTRRWVGLLIALQLVTPAVARAASTSGQLWTVSCSSSSACSAVGDYVIASTGLPMPLAERFDGKSWHGQTVPTPSGTQFADLHGVACPTAAYCIAVGSLHISGISRAFVEAWNGSAWQMQTAAVPAGAKVSGLGAVNCQSATACTAVGNYALYQKPAQTLAESWNGSTWQLQTTPNATAATNKLLAVSCPSAAECVAVGYYNDSGGIERPLAEQSSGSTWQIQPVGAPGATGALLQGVSCPATTSCSAVGTTGDGQLPLAERFDGASWQAQATPLPSGATSGALAAVSCPAAGSCVAVGNTNQGTLAEALSGAGWQVQSTPNPPGVTGSFLEGVSCVAAAACQAAGYAEPTSTTIATLAEGYNGATWALEPS
jgi:hypothetical protein